MRPWKDLALASATEANSRSTRYTFSNSDGVIVSLYAKQISSVEEKIAGTTVSKTTYARSSTPINGEPAATEVETAYSSAAASLTTSTTTYHFSASAFLANRVAVFSARPARVKRMVEIDLPRERRLEMKLLPRFRELHDEIWRLIYEETVQLVAAQ